MNCLICNEAMTRMVHEGVEVDACGSGHGIWIDRRELAQMVHDAASPRPAHEQLAELELARTAGMGTVMDAVRAEGVRACPVCGTDMVKQQWGNTSAIVVDSCAEHGTWVDGGELFRIEAYAEAVRAQMQG